MLTTKAAIIAFIIATAPQHGIDPDLALAVAKVESQYKMSAKSHAGAVGIMQIIPKWHPEFNAEKLRKDPKTNIRAGIKILKKYKESCVHQEGLTWLICYNYGPANARKVTKPHEFRYVVDVQKALYEIRAERAAQRPQPTCLASNQ